MFRAGSIPHNKIDVPDNIKQSIIDKFYDGYRVEEIAVHPEIDGMFTPAQIRRLCSKWKLKREYNTAWSSLLKSGYLCKNIPNIDFFTKWTIESAWLWGLWFGDGWVNKRTVYLSGSIEVLDKVKAISQIDHKPRPQPGCYSLYLGATWLKYWIADAFDLLPGKKSYIIKWPKIDSMYLKHFVRGLLDSDGSLGLNNGYLRFTYASASEDFVKSLSAVISEQVGVQVKKVYTYNKSHFISYGANDTYAVCKWLYDESYDYIRCSNRYKMYVLYGRPVNGRGKWGRRVRDLEVVHGQI